MAGSRWLYLLVAIVAVIVLGYQGRLGGELVYDYGVGTALLQATPTPTPEQPGAEASPGAIPTVTVPSATPTPSPEPSAASPAASPEAKESAAPEESPKASPAAKPSAAAL
jgi:hypothetical protein